MSVDYERGVVPWRHTVGEPRAGIPIVMGRLAAQGEGEAVTLFIPGWGEGPDSAEAAIDVWEERFNRPAAAAVMSFCALPPSGANLLKTALEVPQAAADFVGRGRKVNLAMHSLANTAVLAAAEAPELFAAIFSDSPQPLSSNHWGPESLRPLVAAKRILLDTGRQLAGHRKHPMVGRMIEQGRSDLHNFGWDAWSVTSFGFSNEVSKRAAESYVALDASGHPILVVCGAEDRVVPPGEVRQTLRDTEAAHGLPEGHFEMVVLPDMPHMPWFLSAEAKFTPFDAMLRRREERSGRQPR